MVITVYIAMVVATKSQSALPTSVVTQYVRCLAEPSPRLSIAQATVSPRLAAKLNRGSTNLKGAVTLPESFSLPLVPLIFWAS